MSEYLHPISHCFQDIAEYWPNFRCRQGVPLLNARSFVVNP